METTTKRGFQICPRMDFLFSLHVSYLGPNDYKNVFIHFNKDLQVSGEHPEVLPISGDTCLIICQSEINNFMQFHMLWTRIIKEIHKDSFNTIYMFANI